MALTIGTDSYATLVEIDAIITKRLNSSGWLALTDAEKEPYAIEAMDAIESQNLKGIKYEDNQTLEFPRDWYLNTDTAGTVPTRVKEAQALEAFERYLMNVNNSRVLNNINFGVKREKVRDAEKEYFNNGYNVRKYNGLNFYSSIAERKILPYIQRSFDRV